MLAFLFFAVLFGTTASSDHKDEEFHIGRFERGLHCEHGGSPFGEYSCMCHERYTGLRCEAPFCGRLIGANLTRGPEQGKAIEGEQGKRKCHCNDGYAGHFCELDTRTVLIPEKELPKCGEHGQITESRTCECLPGYSGNNCEHRLKCVRGQETSTTKSWSCECEEGYKGRECDQIECGAHGVAQRGNCVCHSLMAGIHCDACRVYGIYPECSAQVPTDSATSRLFFLAILLCIFLVYS